MAKRKRARLKWVVGSLVVLVGGGWGVMKVAEVMAARDVDAQASKLRKLGYPTTVEEFVARLPKDESQNAAPLYLQAIAEYDAIKKPSWPSKLANGEIDREKRTRLLRQMEGVYQVVAQASKKQQCTFSRDWSQGVNLLFLESPRFIGFGKICAFRAAEAAESGDWRTALSTLKVGMRVAYHAYEPHLIAHLVGTRIELLQLAAFQETVNLHYKDPQFVRAAAEWLRELPIMPDHREAFHFEIVSFRSTLDDFRRPRDGDCEYDDFATSVLKSLLASEVPRRQVHAAFMQKITTRLAASTPDVWADSLNWRDFDEDLGTDTTFSGRVLGMAVQYFGNAPSVRATCESRRRLTAVALWLADQRIQLGILPHQLPDEERFRDPWTGQRYVYIKHGEGFTIRSVGPNKVDDGGERTASGTRTDDIDVQITPVR